MFSSEIFFTYKGANLSCEFQYESGMTDSRDFVTVIGEITTDQEDVFEIEGKELVKIIQEKFWNEVVRDREEVRSDKFNVYEAKGLE